MAKVLFFFSFSLSYLTNVTEFWSIDFLDITYFLVIGGIFFMYTYYKVTSLSSCKTLYWVCIPGKPVFQIPATSDLLFFSVDELISADLLKRAIVYLALPTSFFQLSWHCWRPQSDAHFQTIYYIYLLNYVICSARLRETDALFCLYSIHWFKHLDESLCKLLILKPHCAKVSIDQNNLIQIFVNMPSLNRLPQPDKHCFSLWGIVTVSRDSLPQPERLEIASINGRNQTDVEHISRYS